MIVALVHGLKAVKNELRVELWQGNAICMLCQAEEPNELVQWSCSAPRVPRLWNNSFVPHNRLERVLDGAMRRLGRRLASGLDPLPLPSHQGGIKSYNVTKKKTPF